MRFQFGDVTLIHGNDPISYAIQYLTRSYWSHSKVALNDGLFAEMGPLGLITGMEKEKNPYLVLRHRELIYPNTPRAQKILQQMRQVVENLKTRRPRFDYASMLRLGLMLIRRKVSASVSDGETGPFVCSALVDYIYQQAGLDLIPGKKATDTTPANLEELAFGNNPVFKVVYDSRTA